MLNVCYPPKTQNVSVKLGNVSIRDAVFEVANVKVVLVVDLLKFHSSVFSTSVLL